MWKRGWKENLICTAGRIKQEAGREENKRGQIRGRGWVGIGVEQVPIL